MEGPEKEIKPDEEMSEESVDEESLTFTLNDDGEIEEPDKKKEEDKDSKKTDDDDKSDDSKGEKKFKFQPRDSAFAAMRVEIKELRAKLAEKDLPPKETKETPEELEDGLSKKPIDTINKIVNEKVEAEIATHKEQLARQNRFNSILNESRAKVEAKHPELADPNSEKYNAMLEVIEKNPGFTTNEHGPILAMYEMEALLKQRGYKEVSKEEKEVERKARADAISRPAGRTTTGKSVTLTSDQLAFCKENDINPKDYAKNLIKFGKSTQGVQV